MLSTAPQSSPASTNSSGNSPGSRPSNPDFQERLEHAIEITRDKQDEFASVAQAEGVSLSVARRLLQVVAGSVTTPSVPTLGRATEEAGQRAGQLLEVIDEVAQPKVKQATADEIFLAPTGLDARRTRQPVLGRGRMVEARDGPDVGCGIRPVCAAQRRRPGQWQRPGQGAEAGACPTLCREDSPDLEDSLDIFHTFREGGRALRKTGRGQNALERAEAAQKELDRLGRAGESRTGHATSTSRLWRQAEGLWDQAMAAERAWKLTRSAFEFFTPEGPLQRSATGPGGCGGGACAT